MTDLRDAKMSRAQFFRMMGGLTVAAAATACSTNPQAGGTTAGGASGDAAVSLKFVGVADEKAPMDELVALYRQVRSNVSIAASYAPTDQVQTSLRTQLGAGNAPTCTSSTPAAAARCR
ncbi:hypothetical protein ACFQX6_39390 [Streptosporangium lutulentum]